MRNLDYFDDLESAFDFVPIPDVDVDASIDKIVQASQVIDEQINELEKRVRVLEDDITVLSELGHKLHREESRLQLQHMTEELLIESNVCTLRAQLAELYGTRQSMAKAISKLAVHDDQLNTTCSVCMERIVSVYNHNCGHTMCDRCSTKVNRCPICRSVTNYRKILFSF